MLVTTHSYVGLFKRIMAVVGPLYFELGTPLLDSTLQNVAAW